MARALVVLGFALVVLAGMGAYGVGAEETETLEERVEALEARLAGVEGGVAPVSPNLAPDGSILDLDAFMSADPVIVLVCAQTDPLAGMGLTPLRRSMMPTLVTIHCARVRARARGGVGSRHASRLPAGDAEARLLCGQYPLSRPAPPPIAPRNGRHRRGCPPGFAVAPLRGGTPAVGTGSTPGVRELLGPFSASAVASGVVVRGVGTGRWLSLPVALGAGGSPERRQRPKSAT